MPFLDENITIIKDKRADMYNTLLDVSGINIDNAAYSKASRNGEKYMVICIAGEEYMLNSSYDPTKEAQRYAQKFAELYDNSALLLLGFGNGTFIREILKIVPDTVNIYAYEPYKESFVSTLHDYDIRDILERDNVHIYVKGINENQLKIDLEVGINYINSNMFYMDSLPKYSTLFQKDYMNLIQIYKDRKEYINADIATVVKLGTKMIENDIKNLEYIAKSTIASNYIGTFPEDMVAIVVSAGPSLKNDIEELKKAKSKGFIIAVDTVAKYLLDNDLKPDIVVAVDMIKEMRFFDDDRLKDIPLAIHLDINHSVLEARDGENIILASSDNPIYNDLIREYGCRIDSIPQGGSVANMAYSLAVYWGFKKVVLVGQDLAMTSDTVHVGEESFDRDSYGRHLYKIPGSYEDYVYSTEDFMLYIKWFEMIFEVNKHIDNINATSSGALLRGARLMTMKEVVDNYCTHTYDIQGILASKKDTFSKEQQEEINHSIVRYSREFDDIEKALDNGKVIISRAIKMLKYNTVKGNELQRINSQLDDIGNIYDKSHVSFLITRYAAKADVEVTSDLYMPQGDQRQESIRLYEKLDTYYEGLKKAVRPVEAIYKSMIEKIED